MEELFCSRCCEHLGWMNCSGPHGSVYCDECKEIKECEAIASAFTPAEETSHDG